MYREFYKDMDLTQLPLFALVLFISVFLIVVVRTFVFRRAHDFDNVARLPFSEGGASHAEVRHE